MISLAESRRRSTAMQKLLREKGLDGALFIFPIDVYYYAGTRQNATLWIPAEGQPMLLVRRATPAPKKTAPWPTSGPFPPARIFRPFSATTSERSVLPSMWRRCSSSISTASCCRGGNLSTSRARTANCARSKSAFELERLRQAGAASCAVFAAIPQFLQPRHARNRPRRRARMPPAQGRQRRLRPYAGLQSGVVHGAGRFGQRRQLRLPRRSRHRPRAVQCLAPGSLAAI